MMKFNNSIFKIMFVNFSLMFLFSIFLIIYTNNNEFFIEMELIQLKSFLMSLILVIDFTSMFFLSTVMLISFSVMIYSMNYMNLEKFSSQFSLLVVIFIISMMMLICSPNLFSILLGWDGLGVSSFLLVNFYKSEKSFNSSFITVGTNRIGDAMIIISLALISPNFSHNFFILSFMDNYNNFISLFLILGAMTKSAIIPFSSWLPAAMAAPTPVSSLVHSSTLVTAGIYLVIRMNNLISLNMKTFIMIMGTMTMIMASMAAMSEVDFKKIVALTTLTNLGVMFMTLGLSMNYLAFIHLISHAYFKAMIFMSAGLFIHSAKDYQDYRIMSSMKMCPINSSILLCGMWSSMTAPFFCSFYSKDFILEMVMMSEFNLMIFSSIILLVLTSMIYSLKLVTYLLMENLQQMSNNKESDVNSSELFSMFFLFFFSIIGGWSLLGNYFIESPIILPISMKIIPSMIMLIFFMINWNKKSMKMKKSSSLEKLMWFLPFTLTNMIILFNLKFSKTQFLVTDKSFFSSFFYNFFLSTNFFLMKFFFKSLLMIYFIYFYFLMMIL